MLSNLPTNVGFDEKAKCKMKMERGQFIQKCSSSLQWSPSETRCLISVTLKISGLKIIKWTTYNRDVLSRYQDCILVPIYLVKIAGSVYWIINACQFYTANFWDISGSVILSYTEIQRYGAFKLHFYNARTVQKHCGCPCQCLFRVLRL